MTPATQHMDPVVAARLRRGVVTHLESEGGRRADGPSIPGLWDRPTVQADTVCGLRLSPNEMTKRPGINVTCPDCQADA